MSTPAAHGTSWHMQVIPVIVLISHVQYRVRLAVSIKILQAQRGVTRAVGVTVRVQYDYSLV